MEKFFLNAGNFCIDLITCTHFNLFQKLNIKKDLHLKKRKKRGKMYHFQNVNFSRLKSKTNSIMLSLQQSKENFKTQHC